METKMSEQQDQSEKFIIDWSVREVLEDQFGIELHCELRGHPDISQDIFVSILSLDEEVINRAIKSAVESLQYSFVVALEKKKLGSLKGKLGHLKEISGFIEDCCADCVKRQLGLLPPLENNSAPGSEEILPTHAVEIY
jgi:hypothetical protein